MLNNLLHHLDRTRRLFWSIAIRVGLGPWFIRDRSARVTLIAVTHILVAFACTLAAPLWLLLLGPLILGVPHVISDVRYLLIRPPQAIERVAVLAILFPLGLMTLSRGSLLMGGPSSLTLEVGCGMAALVGAVLLVPLRNEFRLLLMVGLLGIGAWVLTYPALSLLVLGHAHNLIAFALWLAWSKGEGPWHRYMGVVFLYILCIACLGLGWLEPMSASLGAFSAPQTGLDFHNLTATLAPSLSPTLGFRLVLIFAFAQAVHYAVWLRLVPNNHTFYERRGPSSFRRNFDALRKDLGNIGLFLCICLAILLPVLGLFDAHSTRDAYLSLVLFHGWLEIAVVAHLLARRLPFHESPPAHS